MTVSGVLTEVDSFSVSTQSRQKLSLDKQVDLLHEHFDLLYRYAQGLKGIIKNTKCFSESQSTLILRETSNLVPSEFHFETCV
ncbi:hypothetical protein WN51_01824 [Melipona quadrifasciata]|uniref:Uncharacterized protein n=1 Tax=Melipona quadrifasciata TaxID=166423 RepID=A0A0N0BEZ3_9HYME|nr:hypothetical protein WN51_01824 [Melipona quadrifasciata]